MLRVYEPRDLLEAEMLLALLDSEGIEAFLAGRHLIGAIGELPACGLLGVMVQDEDAACARELIEAYMTACPCPDAEPDSGPGVLLC
ncbi:putative signal transducing protein [Pseudomonas duriflava]|uniref:Putative signal transducing protein n=1 Tax=Pseudomonas duriflava TaxID=459528 RepID=A0A562QDQ1_9PSED|nr:DUF2007 domain-containing protein [Pseudomonas duriflava]TWI54895.1 putative signal transducing protein [Pseudomonas duriflava]